MKEQREAEEAIVKELGISLHGYLDPRLREALVRREQKLQAYQRAVEEVVPLLKDRISAEVDVLGNPTYLDSMTTMAIMKRIVSELEKIQ